MRPEKPPKKWNFSELQSEHDTVVANDTGNFLKLENYSKGIAHTFVLPLQTDAFCLGSSD